MMGKRGRVEKEFKICGDEPFTVPLGCRNSMKRIRHAGGGRDAGANGSNWYPGMFKNVRRREKNSISGRLVEHEDGKKRKREYT